ARYVVQLNPTKPSTWPNPAVPADAAAFTESSTKAIVNTWTNSFNGILGTKSITSPLDFRKSVTSATLWKELISATNMFPVTLTEKHQKEISTILEEWFAKGAALNIAGDGTNNAVTQT